MIPPELALLGWIPLAAMCMATPDSAKGFSLAMLGAILLLPSATDYEIVSGMPDLDKWNVAGFGVLAGTIIFHSNMLMKFRPRSSDALLGAMLLLIVATSVSSGLGLYDGISSVVNQLAVFVLPVILARIHLGTPKAIKTFLRILVWLSVPYAVLALYEFRMSPQIHTTLYGYFQHVFLQHRRGGFWRPIVCFNHALALGRFFAFATFIAAFPMRQELARQHPIGKYLFLAPLAGLIASMSYGPWLLCMLFCGFYPLMKKRPWLSFAMPAGAIIWLAMVFSGAQPLYGVVNTIEGINPARAQSLHYRLKALDEYADVILERPLLGWGRGGTARMGGRATDSVMLIRCLDRGMLGAALLFGWWLVMLYNAVMLVRKMPNSDVAVLAASVAAVIPPSFAMSAIDSALENHLMYMVAGMTAVYGLVKTGKLLPLRLAAPRRAPLEVPMHRPAEAARMALRVAEARQRRRKAPPREAPVDLDPERREES